MTHSFIHTLDLILTYDIEPHNLLVLPLNPILSSHYLITFKFNILDVTTHNKRYYYSTCLSDNAANKLMEVIVSHLSMVESSRTFEGDDLKCSPANIDCLVNKTPHILDSA